MRTNRILLTILVLMIFNPIYADSNDESITTNDKVIQNKKFDRINKRKEFLLSDFYQEFKNDLEKYGLSYSVDFTYMPQRGSPNGSKTPQQFIVAPNVGWTIFSDKNAGELQLEFAYTAIRYWGEQAEILQNKIGVGSGINDYTTEANQFSQFLLSYTLPNEMNWLSINIGQYSLYFIDGTPQTYNQQTGFISYSLSQNGSASYPVASFGAYLQFSPTPEWMMQIGFQDANNIDGNKIDFSTLHKGDFTSYAYISWNPTFKKTWAGQYMFLTYNQPSTLEQVGDSDGWSFSFSQYFGEIFNIFGRINGSSGNVVPIERSYVAGFGFKNPFERNVNDYLGLALSVNRMSEEALGTTPIHKYENVLEAQYVIGLGKYITITPDIQYVINPALNVNRNSAFVYSLRLGIAI